MRVLGKQQRVKAALLHRRAQFGYRHAVVGREDREAELHARRRLSGQCLQAKLEEAQRVLALVLRRDQLRVGELGAAEAARLPELALRRIAPGRDVQVGLPGGIDERRRIDIAPARLVTATERRAPRSAPWREVKRPRAVCDDAVGSTRTSIAVRSGHRACLDPFFQPIDQRLDRD